MCRICELSTLNSAGSRSTVPRPRGGPVHVPDADRAGSRVHRRHLGLGPPADAATHPPPVGLEKKYPFMDRFQCIMKCKPSIAFRAGRKAFRTLPTPVSCTVCIFSIKTDSDFLPPALHGHFPTGPTAFYWNPMTWPARKLRVIEK